MPSKAFCHFSFLFRRMLTGTTALLSQSKKNCNNYSFWRTQAFTRSEAGALWTLPSSQKEKEKRRIGYWTQTTQTQLQMFKKEKEEMNTCSQHMCFCLLVYKRKRAIRNKRYVCVVSITLKTTLFLLSCSFGSNTKPNLHPNPTVVKRGKKGGQKRFKSHLDLHQIANSVNSQQQ